MSKRGHSLLFEECILKSWWAILVFLLCYFVYDQAMHRKNEEEKLLHQKLFNLQAEKREALLTNEDLSFQIESQEDPAWIELTLMKELGLVPEGAKKVVFQ